MLAICEAFSAPVAHKEPLWDPRPQTYYLLLEYDMDCKCETWPILVLEIEDEVLSRGMFAFDGPKEMSLNSENDSGAPKCYRGQLGNPMRLYNPMRLLK